MFLLAQLRNCFQEMRLRLFQLSNEPPMVVTINRLVWRPLYRLAESRYKLS